MSSRAAAGSDVVIPVASGPGDGSGARRSASRPAGGRWDARAQDRDPRAVAGGLGRGGSRVFAGQPPLSAIFLL